MLKAIIAFLTGGGQYHVNKALDTFEKTLKTLDKGIDKLNSEMDAADAAIASIHANRQELLKSHRQASMFQNNLRLMIGQ